MPNKKKNVAFIVGGTYADKIGKIAKGKPTKSGVFLNPNRPLYFKSGAGKVMGSKAINNAVWFAESAADSAFKNRIKINADIAPGYDWTKAAKVNKIRTAGKVLSTIGKTANIVGVGLTAGEGIYKGTKRALDNPEFHRGKAGKSYIDLSVKKPGKYGVDY